MWRPESEERTESSSIELVSLTRQHEDNLLCYLCVMCCVIRIKSMKKCTLTSATPRFWNEAKFPFSAPVRKNLSCFKMVGEWPDVFSPFCEMSLYFRPCFGYLWSFYHRKRCLSLLETTIECLRVGGFREFDLSGILYTYFPERWSH